MSPRRSVQEIYYRDYEYTGFKPRGKHDTPVWSHVQKIAGGGTAKVMAAHSYSPVLGGGHEATITVEMHPHPDRGSGRSGGSYVNSKRFGTKADAINWLRSQAPSTAKQHYRDSDLEPDTPSSESLDSDRAFARMVWEDASDLELFGGLDPDTGKVTYHPNGVVAHDKTGTQVFLLPTPEHAIGDPGTSTWMHDDPKYGHHLQAHDLNPDRLQKLGFIQIG